MIVILMLIITQINMESKSKQEAESIFNKHYCSILEYGEELSQEIVISLLAGKGAMFEVDAVIDNCESLSRSVFWQEVKQELNKMLPSRMR